MKTEDLTITILKNLEKREGFKNWWINVSNWDKEEIQREIKDLIDQSLYQDYWDSLN